MRATDKGIGRKAHTAAAIPASTPTLCGMNVRVSDRAYPSHHLDSMRGLTNVSFIYLDEADFFPPEQAARC